MSAGPKATREPSTSVVSPSSMVPLPVSTVAPSFVEVSIFSLDLSTKRAAATFLVDVSVFFLHWRGGSSSLISIYETTVLLKTTINSTIGLGGSIAFTSYNARSYALYLLSFSLSSLFLYLFTFNGHALVLCRC